MKRLVTPLILVLTLVIATGACSGSDSKEDPVAELGDGILVSVVQDDASLARGQVALARSLWGEVGFTTYSMQVGYESFGSVTAEVVDGAKVGDPVVSVGANPDFVFEDQLPLTVEEAFEEMEVIVEKAEAFPAADDGSCDGVFFNFRFDTEFGNPTYYDRLGPCDDGVGIFLTVTESD
jgi:hypothetical protein